jgi:hypothetical protein
VSFLTAPEWTSSCQSSGFAGILPFATHPPLSRFRVNGSHRAGWAALTLYRHAISGILPFTTHPPLSRFRVNGSHCAAWAAICLNATHVCVDFCCRC